ALQFDEQNLIDLAAPMFLGPAAQVVARKQAGLVVVGAEVSGAGVRNIDGDERDVSLHVLGGDGGRDDFVGLEFDDQVDLFANQVVGAAQSDLGLIAIVD